MAAGEAGRALISVYDKTGIVPFARGLAEMNWSIVSSGGAADAISEAGVEVTEVADITGWGSMLDGRVKTLHPLIHGGILADLNNPQHLATMEEKGIRPFSLVCVDMYPLEETIAQPGVTLPEIIEKIDVGGPTMLNGAAKSGKIVLSRADQREPVLEWLREGRPNEEEFIRDLARTAFYETMRYYSPLVKYLGGTDYSISIGKKVAPTKYGENPQQTEAGFYADNRINVDPLGLDQFEHRKGWELSYVNETDIDRLVQTSTHVAAGFERNFGEVPPMAIAVKHGNPCGAGVGESLVGAVEKAIDGDTRAIFGGVVMINGVIDKEVAETLTRYQVAQENPDRLLDGVIGSNVTEDALEILKRAKLRVVINPALAGLNEESVDQSRRLRAVRGGMLEQDNYTFIQDLSAEFVEQYGDITEQQKRDLILAWAIGSTSNSNTITLVKDGMLIGNGVGQQDRVGAGQLALSRSTTELPLLDDVGAEPLTPEEEKLFERLLEEGLTTDNLMVMKVFLDKAKIEGAVAYSDSFFPFPDGPELLVKAGVKAILTSWNTEAHKDILRKVYEAGAGIVMIPDKVGRGFFGH